MTETASLVQKSWRFASGFFICDGRHLRVSTNHGGAHLVENARRVVDNWLKAVGIMYTRRAFQSLNAPRSDGIAA
jgi:hypothetical protein